MSFVMSLLLCLCCYVFVCYVFVCYAFLCFCLGPGPWGPWAHGPRPLGPMGPIFNTFGPGAGAGSPWARGLGAPGPKLQDTNGECNYLLSGRLPTVRQAISRCQRCTQKPHTCTQTLPYTCTQQPHTLHPTTAYMHPTVSI